MGGGCSHPLLLHVLTAGSRQVHLQKGTLQHPDSLPHQHAAHAPSFPPLHEQVTCSATALNCSVSLLADTIVMSE